MIYQITFEPFSHTECHLSTRFALEIPEGFSERLCIVLCSRSLSIMFSCWQLICTGTFETLNLKGRRGSRERKESAALRRECWRVLDHGSDLTRAFLSRNLGFLGLRGGRRPSLETVIFASFFLLFFQSVFGRPFFDFW